MRTTFPLENSESDKNCTDFAQNPARPSDRRVKFPVTIKHRASKAKIYAPAKNFAYYRLSYAVAGKRRMQTFATYSEAKDAGERIVREIAQGSQAASLTAGQSQDALAAFERLETFRQSTGRKFSLLGVVSEALEAIGKLRGRSLGEAVTGYLGTVVTVQPKAIGEAGEEFIAGSEHLTRAAKGQRAQLSAKYAYNREIQLRKFADTFTGTLVSDLSKEHLDRFISTLGEQTTKSRNRRKIVSAKSRNHYRGVIRQFLQWAVRKDYLSPTHRLFEADAMRPEHANITETEFYTAGELARMLAAAKDDLLPVRPLVAIGGLAGLRTAELLRLDWADVWRVPGHVEIVAVKSKTRQRRLVEICPALAAWLEPYRGNTGKLWAGHEITFQQHLVKLCEAAKAPRKHNGLRHSFCTYHFALHANENLTAAQAGNSPAMIHQHYKGLATKADAEKWFAVKPEQS
jgi:integrase